MAGEHDVDREAHEEHVDRVAGLEPEPALAREALAEHQPAQPTHEVVGPLDLGHEGLVAFSADLEHGPAHMAAMMSMIWSTMGVKMTMNTIGKMQPTMGRSMNTGACMAFFSARWKR